eukprot:12411798-Karenia_brevis.AAC.1
MSDAMTKQLQQRQADAEYARLEKVQIEDQLVNVISKADAEGQAFQAKLTENEKLFNGSAQCV